MAEKYRIFLFAALLLATAGIALIGILITYNLNQTYRRHYLQTLLYQQIFLYSFLFYGVWGRLFLGKVLVGFDISQPLVNKVMVFVSALGLPFLIVSWFMLIKFFYESKNLRIHKTVTIGYFIFYVLLITAGAWFANTGLFLKVEMPQKLMTRFLVILNFVSNCIIIFPLLLNKNVRYDRYNLSFHPAHIMVYLIGVIAYSAGIWIMQEHFLIPYFTILLIFVTSGWIPVLAMQQLRGLPVEENLGKMDFAGFCQKYEISKREAEIILEICSGKSNQDIAESLFITLQTVKDHTHRIYTKTGVKNRIHLANLVREKITKKSL